MKITLEIPDSVWNADPDYPRYFEAMQHMVNRMAMSHFKYGCIKTTEKIDELKSLRQRITMYDPTGIQVESLCTCGSELHTLMGCFLDGKKPVDTGNTENMLDAANMCVLEHLFPKHPKAHFAPQSSSQSPGLAVATGGKMTINPNATNR